MNKKDTQAAIEAARLSRSCATCDEGVGAGFCSTCFKESIKFFGKGIAYERKRRKAEDAVTPERLEDEMRIVFGARARVIDGHRYVTVDWQGFQNITNHFFNIGRAGK